MLDTETAVQLRVTALGLAIDFLRGSTECGPCVTEAAQAFYRFLLTGEKVQHEDEVDDRKGALN